MASSFAHKRMCIKSFLQYVRQGVVQIYTTVHTDMQQAIVNM